MGAKARFLVFFVICSTLAFSSDNDWTEVKSPHFTVLGDGPDEQARSIALSFEQARAIFTEALQGMRTETEAPTVIFATRDPGSMRAVLGAPLPSKWTGTTLGLAGLYMRGEETDYSIVEMGERHTQVVATHEYIHKLLHLNFTRLPTWLDEGLAEFFAYSNSDGHRVILGIKSERMDYLYLYGGFDPPEMVMKGSYRSEYYRNPYKVQIFYTESWALVHYMILGPNMEGGAKLNKFLNVLQQGVEEKKAFQQVFGDMNSFSDGFNKYMSQKSLPAAAFQASIDVSKMPLSVRKLSVPEARIYLAALDLRRHDYDSANKRLASALQDAPKNWFGHEQIAFLNFSQGKVDDAIKEWNAALELNPKDYLALYYKGLVQYRLSRNASSAAEFKKTLDDVLAIQPNFTLAHVMRSRMLVEMGDLDGAAASARKALNLEPDLAGYFLNYAEIELLQKKYAAALRNAQFVARLWDDADRGEALDLIIRIRAASKLQPAGDEKKEEDDLIQGFAKGTIPVRGEVESVSCSNNRLNSVTVKAEGKEYSFRLKQGSFGFSDTIGITGEHFNVCYHTNGYPIVVRSKGEPILGAVSEMSGFEIRNFLLPGEVE
jgi:tetratricopeptide (TPR) repeat protein